MKTKLPDRKTKLFGFTLVELLATIGIMAVLAAAVFPYIAEYRTWARVSSDCRSAQVIADAIMRYNTLCDDVDGVLITAATPPEEVVDRLCGFFNATAVNGTDPDSYLSAPPKEEFFLANIDGQLIVTYGLGSNT